jgi:hypothetical protein
MQYVTYNKLSLFSQRIKALEKQIFLLNHIFFKMFLKSETLIHSYVKLRCEQHHNAI